MFASPSVGLGQWQQPNQVLADLRKMQSFRQESANLFSFHTSTFRFI
jgi:hypothetical protein